MSKLPDKYRFLDLSDYGGAMGRKLANSLINTSISPVQVTTGFVVVGLLAVVAILCGYNILAGVLITLKSIIDAADGALARMRNTPSYTGRYYDSIADFFLNFLFLFAIYWTTDSSFVLMILAFISIELQGTFYNFYYIILRHKTQGDKTSQIFEDEVPTALPADKQSTVNRLFKLYKLTYGGFDRFVYSIDRDAVDSKPFPNWFMTILSLYGLGFQLLIISVMLFFNLQEYILPFFIFYSGFIIFIVGIRKSFL